MLDFEAALARALERAGLISRGTTDAISRHCDVAHFDLDEIDRSAETAGNEAIPMVDQLRTLVAEVDASAAASVHWGATSQDAIDTALVLQLRDAFRLIDGALVRLITVLADLAEAHADAPMVGRTLLQEAAPTTFGFKVAGW